MVGYADRETAYPEYNQKLSERRVNAVRDYLVDECGIDPSRLVMDARGKVLVEIRTLSKDYAPGQFDACVGGVVQSGEDPIVSAGRELYEEIGVTPEQVHLHYLGKQAIPYQFRDSFVMAYLFMAQGDFISVRQKSEVSGIMYLSCDQLRALQSSCTYDSVRAFEEIITRAHEQGLLSAELC